MTYVQTPNARDKVMCTECGATGFPGCPWQTNPASGCDLPHTFKCACGKSFPTWARLRLHISPTKRIYDRDQHKEVTDVEQQLPAPDPPARSRRRKLRVPNLGRRITRRG